MASDLRGAAGQPIGTERASEIAEKAWGAWRRETLKDHGLWEVWKDVPPPEERDGPLEEYLPDDYGRL